MGIKFNVNFLPIRILFVILFVSTFSLQANGQVFNNIINLSNSPLLSSDAEAAAVENNVYVAWRDSSNGNDDILFTRSADNGASFGEIINLSNDLGFSFNPKIAADRNNVYVTWTDSSAGNNQIYFTRSTDNGASFGGPINLSNSPGNSDFSQITFSGSNVYVAWRDNSPGNPEVFFMKSSDNGASFGGPINLSNNLGISGTPQISASGSFVHVGWQDTSTGNDEIFLRTSGDNGTTFLNTVNISNSSAFDNGLQMTAHENNIHMIWTERTPQGTHVFFKSSSSNGERFENSIDLSNFVHTELLNSPSLVSLMGPSENVAIDASDSNVYGAWSDNILGNSEIFFVKSATNGIDFVPRLLNLSNNFAFSTTPNIAVNNDNVYVVWSDTSPGNNDIFIVSSSDNGSSFGPAINLSNNNGLSEKPKIIASGNSSFVTWEDLSQGNREIFFSALR